MLIIQNTPLKNGNSARKITDWIQKNVYIGDSEQYYIVGAKNAGVYAIGIAHNGKKINNSKDDFVCYSFEKLKEIPLSSYKFSL